LEEIWIAPDKAIAAAGHGMACKPNSMLASHLWDIRL